MTIKNIFGQLIYNIGYLYLSLWNHFFTYLPSYDVRYFILKYLYMVKMKNVNIHMGVKFWAPWRVIIGDQVNIQYGCFLDGRGGLSIADKVDVCPYVKIVTLSHDIDKLGYPDKKGTVCIESKAIIFSYALICPSVTVGEGAVVAAGSVVTKSVPKKAVVGGNPAVIMKYRSEVQMVSTMYRRPFH